jgi:hypothetical protein
MKVKARRSDAPVASGRPRCCRGGRCLRGVQQSGAGHSIGLRLEYLLGLQQGWQRRLSGSTWNIYEGYKKIGNLRRSGSGWNVYSGYSKVGSARRSGSNYNCYEGYQKIGRATGSGAQIGCAALLLYLIG